MAGLADAQFTLLSIIHLPDETVRLSRESQEVAGLGAPGATPIVIRVADPAMVEDRGDATERTLAERSEYLQSIVARMPPGPKYSVETTIANDVTAAIIRYAMQHQPDVIVMGTHGETGTIHRLFGDTAEAVVRSGVAPVLLVHSKTARRPAKT
jgi:nucleotide-binding universal stress UspA family protein